MARNYPDWIKAFIEYASCSEAPEKMRYWTAVATVAGALRRKVWIDQAYFKWICNFYIVFVAKPGIVSKSTTADVGMNLLRRVPGIKFGADVVTWQSLVTNFAAAMEEFALPSGEFMKMCALTIVSSEFGNLLNPTDREMVDILVSLWDGRAIFEKSTKGSGNDRIENPWINIIACTTPSWIAGSFPEYMIGGGFTSRCVFVYVEDKEKYIAYPGLIVPADISETEKRLVQDLEHISLNLAGEYALTREALEWGKLWYEEHYKNRPEGLDDARFGGYIARKQTHIHKLAMVIAASQRDRLVITSDDLQAANNRVTDLEKDMPLVFGLIGRSEISLQTERLIQYVHRRKSVEYNEAYRYVHDYFPEVKLFESIVEGAVRAGFLRLAANGNKTFIISSGVPYGAQKNSSGIA